MNAQNTNTHPYGGVNHGGISFESTTIPQSPATNLPIYNNSNNNASQQTHLPSSQRSTTNYDVFDPNYDLPQRQVNSFLADNSESKQNSGRSANSRDSKAESIASDVDLDALEKAQDAELPTKCSYPFHRPIPKELAANPQDYNAKFVPMSGHHMNQYIIR